MRRVLVAILPIAAVAIVVAAVLVHTAPGGIRTSVEAGPLPPEDAVRLAVQVKPIGAIGLATGLISRADALAAASNVMDGGLALPDAYLQLMTDPSASRGDDPITDRPMWVVRYSGLSVISPGGKELQYAYVVIDARTGVEHHTSWSP